MAKDYKRRAAPAKKKQKKPVPGWIWFIGGLLVGLFFSGLAWLKLGPAEQVTVIQQMPPKEAEKKPEKKTEPKKTEPEPETAKPRFDFYTILPEMEVVVPDPEPELKPQPKPQVREVADTAHQIAAEAKPSQKAPARASGYMLQMGSFRKYADADRLKASLALIGMQAEIQKVTINSGEVFHRVRSGPYSRDQVNKLRAKLKENKISSLVIKLKG
ncbi:MAG: SPOR domain-containing protein [Chromatiales bacterium]|nr:SPOR domain-containing protein [Chromatiales bacterium]